MAPAPQRLPSSFNSADIQDRHAALTIIRGALGSYPSLRTIFADGGYTGDALHIALLNLEPTPEIEIVKRPRDRDGFIVITKRWVVERTFAWFGRCRRLAKNWETTTTNAGVWMVLAATRRQNRFLARKILLLS